MTAEARCRPHDIFLEKEETKIQTFPTIFLLSKFLPIEKTLKETLLCTCLSLLICSRQKSDHKVYLCLFLVGYNCYIAPLNCPNLLTTAFLELCALLFLAVVSWYISSASLIYFLGAQNLASLQMFGWAQPSISTKGYFSDLNLNLYDIDLLDMPIRGDRVTLCSSVLRHLWHWQLEP